MKTFTIPVIKTVSGYVTVEANSVKEARKLVDTMPDLDTQMEISDTDFEVLHEEIQEE